MADKAETKVTANGCVILLLLLLLLSIVITVIDGVRSETKTRNIEVIDNTWSNQDHYNGNR